VGDRFGQLDRPVDRADRAWLDLDSALFLAVGTVDAAEFLEGNFASSFFLNGSAKTHTEFMSGQLNLIEVRNLIALLKGLNFSRNHGGLFEVMFEFFLQLCFIRVHAIVSK
jgi:hypothetical protein